MMQRYNSSVHGVTITAVYMIQSYDSSMPDTILHRRSV